MSLRKELRSVHGVRRARALGARAPARSDSDFLFLLMAAQPVLTAALRGQEVLGLPSFSDEESTHNQAKGFGHFRGSDYKTRTLTL